MLVYLDTSAAVKLIVREAQSDALRTWLADHPRRGSSAIMRTELLRTVRRAEPERLDRAIELLGKLALQGIDDELLTAASRVDPIGMRSLDAIHLATAIRWADELEAIVTYDRRMIEGARALGLPVASPA
jgi:uncharacterized protein